VPSQGEVSKRAEGKVQKFAGMHVRVVRPPSTGGWDKQDLFPTRAVRRLGVSDDGFGDPLSHLPASFSPPQNLTNTPQTQQYTQGQGVYPVIENGSRNCIDDEPIPPEEPHPTCETGRWVTQIECHPGG